MSRIVPGVFGAVIGAIVGMIVSTTFEADMLQCALLLGVAGFLLGLVFGYVGLEMFQWFQ